MISGCVPKFLEAIKTEMDRTVVMQAVDSIQVKIFHFNVLFIYRSRIYAFDYFFRAIHMGLYLKKVFII